MTDFVRKFAQDVAPLYVAHDWLGLRYKPYEEVVDRLTLIARGLYNNAVEHAEDRPDERYLNATARMIATYEPWNDGPEIRLGLDLETFILHEGEFVALFDERFDDEDSAA